jgi:hypothetical protein
MTDTAVRPIPLREYDDSQPPRMADGTFYVVGRTVPIDGRISWYASEHIGRHLLFNSYLFKGDGGAFLLEAGVPRPSIARRRKFGRSLGKGPRSDGWQ